MCETCYIDTVNLNINIDTVNMKKTSNYHHGNLRDALIEKALEILDEKGIDAVGVRLLARELGVAHSAPANHFKNKQDLFTTLAIEIFSQLLNELSSSQHPELTGIEEQLQCLAKSVMNYAFTHPNRYRLMWRRDCLDNQHPALLDVMEEVYQLLINLLKVSAQKQKIDVESLAIAFWSMIHGYVSLRLDGNLMSGTDSETGQDRQTAIVDVMLKGLTV